MTTDEVNELCEVLKAKGFTIPEGVETFKHVLIVIEANPGMLDRGAGGSAAAPYGDGVEMSMSAINARRKARLSGATRGQIEAAEAVGGAARRNPAATNR